MAVDSDIVVTLDRQEEQNDVVPEEEAEPASSPAHHPTAPPDELFDISTTVDPSYIISLIRKLLPVNDTERIERCYVNTTENNGREKNETSLCEDGNTNLSMDEIKLMDTLDGVGEVSSQKGEDEESQQSLEHCGMSEREKTWEECGCILWDLAANKDHAEFMVQNLVLEVLSASLMVSKSARATVRLISAVTSLEISLGILGNLACHEVPGKLIASTNGLIGIIVDQLFLDDTPCLSEACRLLSLGLQGKECIAWAEALQSEHILGRLLWVAENTLSAQLIEKSAGLCLAILENQQEVMSILLPTLMKLGLPNLLISLLDFEISKLKWERAAERYPVLDLILRAIEALSVIDGYSQEVCSNKELLHLIRDLIELSDKDEVASSCVTAAVLTANIMSDAPEVASEIAQDLTFLQGLLEILPFASDDLEARSAVWSTIGRILALVQESKLSPSSLCQYVLVLVSKSDILEEDLLDHQVVDTNKEHESLTSTAQGINARTMALRRIIDILILWTSLREHHPESRLEAENCSDDSSIKKMLDYCRKYT
ncbi:hypothetical protein RJ641_033171, partial [Dillenia turbinata]